MKKVKKLLLTDVNNIFNKYFLIAFIFLLLIMVGFTSYALFSFEVEAPNNVVVKYNPTLICDSVTAETSTANNPQNYLVSGMLPVCYDSIHDLWLKADPTNTNSSYRWYSYSGKAWANAVTVTATNRESIEEAPIGTSISMEDINTMWVWIPRYSYTIKSEDGTNYYGNGGTSATAPGSIDIKFVNTSIVETGSAQYTGTTPTNYYTHPAFAFDGAKAGIWIAKFETSHSDVSTSYVVDNLGCTNTSCANASGILIKPDAISLRGNNVSSMFMAARSMQVAHYNTYGFPNNQTYDVHMLKNDEWGAVAYLSQSIYGKCSSATSCEEVYINNSGTTSRISYTGRSGGNVGGSTPINEAYEGQTATETYNTYGFYTYDGYLLNYNTNTKSSTRNMSKVASTTGNIYGIYDMSGGLLEFVMGNYNNYSGRSLEANSGFNGVNNDSSQVTDGIDFYGIMSNNKYYNKYTITDYSSCTKAICGGHALNETKGWYGDDDSGVYIITGNSPWTVRGGISTTSDGTVGIFDNSYNTGTGVGHTNFRIAIIK